MSRIRILPENVANKIAAGEVVERPASVVKELVENSLDAGAKTVRVEAESGGKRLIRITDDGSGMLHDDALLAFERHATSKLRTADDLLSVATLGFRGEALPSIAAVSRLTLETRAAEEEQGTRIEFAGGKLIGVKPAGVPAGTAISVADLFYCVPARRKFLKSETTELGHIASLVTHYALAHPDKHFLLKTPTQEILNATPVETMAERLYQVFGRQAVAEMVEMQPAEAPIRAAITEPEMEAGDETSRIRVSGFVSRPEVQRTNRNGIYIFVNRRLIRDRLVLHAIGEAYRNIMPAGAFAAVLLFIDLPCAEVDVNVHPAKVEVRFRHSQVVHDFVRDAIRMALANARPVPSFPAGATLASSAAAAGAGANAPSAAIGAAGAASFSPSVAENGSDVAGSLPGPPRAIIPNEVVSRAAVETLPGDFELTGAPERPIPQRLNFETREEIVLPRGVAISADACREPAVAESMIESESAGALPGAAHIGDLKPLGQISASYIVAVNGQGLWIVDQHVAHERVLFEKHLAARRAGELGGQRLLMPIVAELSPHQIVIFEQIAEELRANGFEAELIGPRSVAIAAAPAGIASGNAEKLLAEILDGVARESQAISLESLQSRIAASTACQAAIKVNMPLDQTKMEWLLAELAKTEYPMSCPHGRPVVLRYSVREIERAFKRI
ncbi:MAG TPA: DNA mismatch repair endonuclease MutL [Candidatus Acidoferrales bacterium]|nr:DNA mismatch repair endonuclease MutL [Candidatus Acidoferrales bacterium]